MKQWKHAGGNVINAGQVNLYWNTFMKNLKFPDPHSIVNEVFKRS